MYMYKTAWNYVKQYSVLAQFTNNIATSLTWTYNKAESTGLLQLDDLEFGKKHFLFLTSAHSCYRKAFIPTEILYVFSHNSRDSLCSFDKRPYTLYVRLTPKWHVLCKDTFRSLAEFAGNIHGNTN